MTPPRTDPAAKVEPRICFEVQLPCDCPGEYLHYVQCEFHDERTCLECIEEAAEPHRESDENG